MDNAVRPISIHALREEGDLRRHRLPQTAANHFYPRPPRGGRRSAPSGRRSNSAFLSTPSARRATRTFQEVEQPESISIHALREEGDPPVRRCRSSRCRHFYPRPPRGGRRSSSKGNGKACKFLSTPSARRATVRQSRLSGSHQISIHALREEGDTSTRSMTTSTSYFYPRPPRGGRLHFQRQGVFSVEFLSTPSARRATPAEREENHPKTFLSTPSARRATCRCPAQQTS